MPLKISELLAALPGCIYMERCALTDPAQIRTAKRALRHAFELQMNHTRGLSIVELLSACPTYWHMTPVKAKEWIHSEMTRFFPLGCQKDADSTMEG